MKISKNSYIMVIMYHKHAFKENESVIFHVDVNSAFLSWSALELLKRNPDAVDLRTVPSIVGGEVNKRHGVVTAASIPAKRLGINSGEPVAHALTKCPDLVFARADFEAYREYSRAFLTILSSYAPVIEQASIDEAYADLTGTKPAYESIEAPDYPFPYNIAHALQEEIYSTLGFTVNVGISTNRLLAKMASDFSKPNKIHSHFPEEVAEKMWPLPIGSLFGCGKSTSARLMSVGVRAIGDAAHMDPTLLQELLGEKSGLYIYNSANGISHSVVSDTPREIKSVSNETTLPFDITPDNYKQEMPPVLKRLAEKVSGRLKAKGFRAKTVCVLVKTNTFHRHTYQTALPEAISDAATLYSLALSLMDKLTLGKKGLFSRENGIRLVGIAASSLTTEEYRQLSLFDQPEEDKRLLDMKTQIEDRFGPGMIKKGW